MVTRLLFGLADTSQHLALLMAHGSDKFGPEEMMVWDNMVCSESRSKEDRVMTVLGPRFRSLALWTWH